MFPLRLLQEEKPENYPLPVDVPADPPERRLDTVLGGLAVPVLQLHLLFSAGELPGLSEGHYQWGLLCWSKSPVVLTDQQ